MSDKFNKIKETIVAFFGQYKKPFLIGFLAGSIVTSIAYQMMP